MPKKKKRRPAQRPHPRPQSGTPASAADAAAAREAAEGGGQASASRRAERKEEARREREKRIKQARRKQRSRRLIRWGILLGVVALIATIVWFSGREDAELQSRAAAAAQRLSCTEPEIQQDELDAFEALGNANHVEPFAEGSGGVPVSAGAHSGALPGEPKVYDQPIQEANAVHNLEHGYVLVYYAADGDNALDEAAVSVLAGLVESESEVLMAPYPDLASSFALISWGTLQQCTPDGEVDPADAKLVTQAFIDKWKNNSQSPEAAAT